MSLPRNCAERAGTSSESKTAREVSRAHIHAHALRYRGAGVPNKSGTSRCNRGFIVRSSRWARSRRGLSWRHSEQRGEHMHRSPAWLRESGRVCGRCQLYTFIQAPGAAAWTKRPPITAPGPLRHTLPQCGNSHAMQVGQDVHWTCSCKQGPRTNLGRLLEATWYANVLCRPAP